MIDPRITCRQVKYVPEEEWLTWERRKRIGELGFETLEYDALIDLHFEIKYGGADGFKEKAEIHSGRELGKEDLKLLWNWVDHVYYSNEETMGQKEEYTG